MSKVYKKRPVPEPEPETIGGHLPICPDCKSKKMDFIDNAIVCANCGKLIYGIGVDWGKEIKKP